MAVALKLEDMSVDDVCEWLDEKGYSDCLVKIFRGQFISIFRNDEHRNDEHVYVIADQELDGCAIAFGLGSAPGPHWLKDIIPTLGQRLKVLYSQVSTLNVVKAVF